MSKKKIALVILLAALPTSWLVWKTQHGWTEARLERLIAAEVPVGSDRAHVEGWLERYGIPHRYYPPTADLYDYYTSSAKEVGIKKQNLSGMVFGDIAPANEGWFLRSEIGVQFFFDRQGRLVGHTITVAFDFL